MERWAGRTAVVTGASAGIGAAICVALANAGLRVVGLARRPQLIDDLKSQLNGKGSICSRKCDVSKPEEIGDTFRWIEEEFGGADVMVNNAGVFKHGNITDVGGKAMSEKDAMMTIDTNLRGLILCTRHAVSSMKKRGFDGHIVNINSLAGHYVPFSSTFNVYSATKHAVTAFTKALENEFADFKSKIKVTSLSPGLVATDMTELATAMLKMPALMPSDIADAVLYVVSTPPSVNINELTISPISEKRL